MLSQHLFDLDYFFNDCGHLLQRHSSRYHSGLCLSRWWNDEMFDGLSSGCDFLLRLLLINDALRL